jgi:hypothetical protein
MTSTVTPIAQIQNGLPAGAKFVRIGLAGENDYEFVGGQILKGERPGAASGVIVEPEPGFTFLERPDIRTLQHVWIPAKLFDKPVEIKVTMTYSVNNSFDQDNIEMLLENIQNVPGFVSINLA